MKLSKVKSKHGRRYSHAWLLTCIILYIRGPKSYRLLRTSNTLPLPSKSTVARYLRGSKASPGFDDGFFQNFAKRLKDICAIIPGSQNGILTFDEMQVKSALGINQKTMTFNGLVDYGATVPLENEEKKNLDERLADHALVLMFSSLKASYHQPIAFFASKGAAPSEVLAKLIITAIIELEKNGAKVQALVCDGAQSNRGLWKIFGLRAKPGQNVICSFPNPMEINSQRRVNFISDTPHLWKCIRNNLYEAKCFDVRNVKNYKIVTQFLLTMKKVLT